MRKAFVLAAVSAAAVLSAATAQAAIYTVHIDGQIIQQLDDRPSTFDIGTPITLDTTFDSSKIVDWGGTGYQVAFLWTTFGDNKYIIDLAGLKTYARDDYRDGYGGFHVDLGYQTPEGPAYDHRDYPGQVDIIFKDGKIVGTTGSFVPAGNNPGITLANGVINGELSAPSSDPGNLHVVYSPLPLGDTFVVGTNQFLYLNNYHGPQYLAQWDFDNATITIDPVPEPAAWALMIVGFGLVGSAIRRQRTPAAA